MLARYIYIYLNLQLGETKVHWKIKIGQKWSENMGSSLYLHIGDFTI